MKIRLKPLFALVLGITIGGVVSAADSKTIILDVRTPSEYTESHVAGAANIDFLDSSFNDKISKYDKAADYKLYCRSGNRSGKAQKLMESMGFTKVENLGGFAQAVEKLKAKCEGAKPCP